MNLKKLIIGAVIFLFVVFSVLVGALALLFLSDVEISPIQERSPPTFSVLEGGTAAGMGYAVYNFRGEGNITALTYEAKPPKDIFVLNDSRAIQAERFPQLIEDLRALEKYGYTLTVTDDTSIGEGIYVVPSGAIPSYVLFNLQQGSSNGTVLYVGEKDLLLSRGIKRQDWYDSLTEAQRSRVVLYPGTLDDLLDSSNYSMVEDILYQSWAQSGNATAQLSGSGSDTIVLDVENATYLRVIHELDGELFGISDIGPLTFASIHIQPSPGEIFPWEDSTLRFGLNKTNGTPTMSIMKDGKVVEKQFLRRVTDDNVFLKKMQYDDPGEYIISVEDSNKEIASGLLHVKGLDIELMERHGVTFIFSVTVDGEPLENAEAYVSLGNSEKQKFFVSNGQLIVSAKPVSGENIFNIEMFGTSLPYRYINDQAGFLDIYLNYGLPGLALVLVIYFGARLSRRPMYSLRFGDSATYVRQEMRVPTGRALESFRKIRADMNLGKSPITPHEFSMSLKRYLTNGADVTEGNVEEILKKLIDKGLLQAHRDYYQLKGEGDIRRNTLRRMAREKLIECGIEFEDDGEKFITKDFEIGFYGQKFGKKGIIVVNDRSEIKRIMASLERDERSRIEILQANDMIRFVPIDELDDVL